ncbi:helix-turn-helix transcriptional regulator [Dyadobacter luticola]|nr:helix-turn-helix transcriptional regulator [Dyadobacter luticola]
MNNKKEILEKLNALAPTTSIRFKERVEKRVARGEYLERSRVTAINILSALRQRKMTQKDLAELLNVTPQTVNQWVKGNENFTFETIGKIEKALGLGMFELTRPIESVKVEI